MVGPPQSHRLCPWHAPLASGGRPWHYYGGGGNNIRMGSSRQQRTSYCHLCSPVSCGGLLDHHRRHHPPLPSCSKNCLRLHSLQNNNSHLHIFAMAHLYMLFLRRKAGLNNVAGAALCISTPPKHRKPPTQHFTVFAMPSLCFPANPGSIFWKTPPLLKKLSAHMLHRKTSLQHFPSKSKSLMQGINI